MISRQPYGSNHFSDSLLFNSITKLDFTTTGAIVDFLEFRDRSDSNTTSGKQLASGGSDNVVHVWDAAISSITTTQWLHRLEEHMRRESSCLVPLPIEFTCNWWWWRRWVDQVLEHSHRSLLELCSHRIPSVCSVLEQERKRVA
ncbi:BnaC09g53600D [Brassica napus]|uniref:(rape) hypothetical protein n=1 Tax=Brassica napus TaxID=3708 RepID=A0A078IK05_BRANA|nr:unnamed protein product [Brassica napus]CDY49393.1 BnaC09g53600D [Brassica napus]